LPEILNTPALWVLTEGRVLVWVLVLIRLTGLLVTLPGLGQERIPLAVRVSLVVLLATVIAPVVPRPAAPPDGMITMLAFGAVELATGAFMGMVVSWVVEAVSFGGQLMDTQMGFSFVQFLDPATAHPASISGAFLTQLTVLLLFLTGLHHQMILALVASYRVLPMGQGLPMRPAEIIGATGLILAKGFQLAMPAMVVLFFVDVLEGICGKFMPQLQLIQLGFPIKIAVGISIVIVTLREIVVWVVPLLEAAPAQVLRLLGG
jgi:flagellar biosynthesis protein FliR